MPVIHNRLRTLALMLLFLSISSFLIFHVASMWQKGLTSSRDGSDSLRAFVEASDFLSQNLGQDEIAIVPMRDVFYVLNPKLSGRLVDYASIWKEAGVLLQANTTKEETLKVRLFLINYLASNPRVKFVVKDWVDSYATPLYEGIGSDKLMTLLNEVQMFPFTLSTGWSSKVTVYERVQQVPLFGMSLSFPPEQYFVVPSNSSIQFDLNGATVQKTGPNVNFYLPLPGGLNASRQNYLTLGVKFDVENVDLTITFYYDKNRDGGFSYDVDYVKSVVLNQVQQGWTEGKSYVIAQIIPKAEDPVVDVGLFLSGDSNGSVTFSNLMVYRVVTAEDVPVDLSSWLSNNLKQDEIAVASSPEMLFSLNPSLESKLLDYRYFWNMSGVMLQTNVTKGEVIMVRNTLVDFLRNSVQVQYIVRNSSDRYSEYLFEVVASDELLFLFREVKDMFFVSGSDWSSKVTVYERVQQVPLFGMSLSFPPEQYFVVPSNSSIQFDLNGATIQKTGPNVNFYLPLLGGLNASRQNYLTLGVKFDMENVDLTIIFYYDKNRDGGFSYDVDYVKSVVLNQVQQGWTEGKSYVIAQVIPKAEDPVVEVGLFLSGDSNGSVTFSSLNIYKVVT